MTKRQKPAPAELEEADLDAANAGAKQQGRLIVDADFNTAEGLTSAAPETKSQVGVIRRKKGMTRLFRG
ncbi:MAG: hypothetical protein AAF568_07035 [Pseudomonadota bacterium]